MHIAVIAARLAAVFQIVFEKVNKMMTDGKKAIADISVGNLQKLARWKSPIRTRDHTRWVADISWR